MAWQRLAESDAVDDPAEEKSVQDESVRYSKLPLDEIPQWDIAPDAPGTGAAQKEFERVRNLRFLTLPEMASFLRRIPWFYPDDGCYMRAELTAEELEKGNYPAPKKLFVFGDLALKTANSPEGWVYWWYHVAPVIYLGPSHQGSPRSEENVYVFDPAMNIKHPIRLKIWVQSMVGDVRRAKLSLCDETAYSPSSQCHPKNSDAAERAMKDAPRFLRSEWFRLKGLDRDPRKELSDQPPW